MEDAPVSHPNIPPEATDSIANEAAGAQRNNDKAVLLSKKVWLDIKMRRLKGVHGVQLAEKSVPTSNKRSLMERLPMLVRMSGIGLGDSDDDKPLVGKRELPLSRGNQLSPACATQNQKESISEGQFRIYGKAPRIGFET
ncbi:hypothetical protein HU200_045546 [Digitaria exilis]|uniref:Uncharacterized protein n=1 Tax=Digitaria exilis TaxID=1010633 RepID=A0A835AZS8_9POAL|nr:hypothetical protein HU200_045546 [Digitaria exilis]